MKPLLSFLISYVASKVLDSVLRRHPIKNWPVRIVLRWIRRRRGESAVVQWLYSRNVGYWNSHIQQMMFDSLRSYREALTNKQSAVPVRPAWAARQLMADATAHTIPLQLADQAGQRRNIAIALASASLPTAAVGAIYSYLAVDVPERLPLTLCHIGLGASLLWLAWDLTQTGGRFARGRLPHLSVGAVLIFFFWLGSLDGAAILREARSVNPSLAIMGAAILVGAMADKSRGAFTIVTSRFLLMLSGFSLGFTELYNAVATFETSRPYAIAIGSIGLIALNLGRLEFRDLAETGRQAARVRNRRPGSPPST